MWLCRRMTIDLFNDFHMDDLDGRIISIKQKSRIKSCSLVCFIRFGILDMLYQI